MTKRIITSLALIILVYALILLFRSCDNGQETQYIGNMPPMPKVTYDDKEIEVYRGSYGWMSGGSGVMADYAAPYDIIKDKTAVTVKSGDTLNFAFPYTPQKAEVKFWKDNEVVHSSASSGLISIPEFEGIYAIEIFGNWKEGHGIYVIKLEIRE